VKKGKIKEVLASSCNAVSQAVLSKLQPAVLHRDRHAIARWWTLRERLSLRGERRLVVVWLQLSFLTTSGQTASLSTVSSGFSDVVLTR
jgi:hypothetical protein